MVDWGTYRAFDPGVDGEWGFLSRPKASRVFERFLAERGDRIEELRSLLERNGAFLEASDDGLDRLEGWLRAAVRDDNRILDDLEPLWIAVAFDVGVLVGEEIIRRRPMLGWCLRTNGGRRDMSYQRPVICGFGNPLESADICLLMTQLLTLELIEGPNAGAGEIREIVEACVSGS